MRSERLLLSSVTVLTLLLSACAPPKPTSAEQAEIKAREIFGNPDSLELYSVDPYKFGDGKWQLALDAIARGENVLGHLAIVTSEDRLAIGKKLFAGIDAGKHSGNACFFPRHVLVATKGSSKAVFIICFHCDFLTPMVDGYEPDRHTGLNDVGGLESFLNGLLNKAGIPIAPQ